MSHSNTADTPDINIVIRPTHISKVITLLLDKINSNRTNKYTPAVTKVDEWTKADTGVGAAIAAGNQAEKGIWALFVHVEMTIIRTKK